MYYPWPTDTCVETLEQKLVELISALQTSDETMSRAREFAIACGKEVTVSKDVPGFVSNALLMPFINEVLPFPILFYSLALISPLGYHVARKGKRLATLRRHLTEILRVLLLEMISTKHSGWE